ncbi:MAG: acetyl-CoA carboxylase biotin carboxylase subunit [Azospirillum sp.]|nr:acetyl-CoA carboxylase biotin carboxylase subunit [Azospirillum sp.]
MFSKILIANRGEIACRIIKTARRMDIKSVAVYSEADATALHVEIADERVLIGPPPSGQSYLLADKIVEACQRTGAEAVHPGYGFLSERGAFCEALKAAGVVFIGPDPHAMAAMGDKIESKKLAAAAGVSTVPGYLGVIADDEEAVKIAREVGYPVMIKASAGGGGKGMRVAYNDSQVRDGFRSATNEARSSFADDRVFIEKFIEQPRHIEIQVMADGHGNCVYLGERECSIQRRHQKVIEEAPSPFIDAKTRKAMGEQAVALAKAVGYKSAGTVEFIVDANRRFYFLEMNTRLQVEHPVTELVTGLDLVELMIKVAAGEKLPFTQDDVQLRGWAVEARIYAEDPLRNFLPSIGRITRYRPPIEDQHTRVDTGVYEGGEISMYYDPMIAKLCSRGPDRATAIDHMRHALDAFQIRGVGHNISFLAAVMNKQRFLDGNLTTNFIAEEFPEGFQGVMPDEDTLDRLKAVVAFVHNRIAERNRTISGQMPGYQPRPQNFWMVRFGGINTPVFVGDNAGAIEVRVGGQVYALATAWTIRDTLWTGTVDGRMMGVQIDVLADGYRLYHAGADLKLQVMTPRSAELADLMPVRQVPDMSKFLLSPMPGLLVGLAVETGQEVKAGQELCAVEAMKMENILRAEQDGKIGKIHVERGASLAVDQIILEFD